MPKLQVLLRLLCVWSLLLISQLASAHSHVHPETRVGDFERAAEACVRLSALANSSKHQENVDASTAEAVGYPHATKGAEALATGTGRQMLGQAMNVLKATPAEGRVAAMRQMLPQIQARATGGAWSATEMAGANGARAWVGETHTLVIDSAGKVFSGTHVGGAAQFGVVEGQLGVTSWSGLKALF